MTTKSPVEQVGEKALGIKKERLKELLISGLQNAIDYEESRIEACTHMGDKEQEREMKKNIKAWEKMLNFIYPNRPMTMRQYLQNLPNDYCISMAEIMKDKSND